MGTTSSHDYSVDATCQELVEIWSKLNEESRTDCLTITRLFAKGISNEEIVEKHLHTLSPKGREAFLEVLGADQSQ